MTAMHIREVRREPGTPEQPGHYEVEIDVVDTYRVRVHAPSGEAACARARQRFGEMWEDAQRAEFHIRSREDVRALARTDCDSPEACAAAGSAT